MLPRLCSPSLLELPLPACSSPQATVVRQSRVWHILHRKGLPGAQTSSHRTLSQDKGGHPSPPARHVTARFAIQEKNRENLLLLIFILAIERQIAVLSRLD